MVENIGGIRVKTTKRVGQTGGKICMKIKVSRIQPNEWKGTK